MPRYCRRCGRPLDGEHHTEGRKALVPTRRGRGRVQYRLQRTFDCRLRLIQRSPVSGEVSVPERPQRLKALQTAYVHEDRFKPGGDLQTGGKNG